MKLETAIDIIESCPGFLDKKTAAGEAWAYVKEIVVSHIELLEILNERIERRRKYESQKNTRTSQKEI